MVEGGYSDKEGIMGISGGELKRLQKLSRHPIKTPKIFMSNIGRRKEGKYLYTVYLVPKNGISEAREILKEKYKTVIAKRAGGQFGGPRWTHYAVWCRGRK